MLAACSDLEAGSKERANWQRAISRIHSAGMKPQNMSSTSFFFLISDSIYGNTGGYTDFRRQVSQWQTLSVQS